MFTMFLLRGLKKLIVWGILAGLVYMAAHYPVKGRPLYQAARDYFSAKGFGETLKDLRGFFGGFLKSVGEELEDVSDKDKKQLEELIEKEMEKKP